MSDYVETWQVRKPAVHGHNGAIATQHRLASRVGAEVLVDGGNAIDAAVAAGLAIGAVEPWMSGLGGCGFMMIYDAGEQRVSCVDFGTVAPRRLDPAVYALRGEQASELFAWPGVIEDRNLQGPHAITVPTLVAGHALALERFGTKPWSEALVPAIRLAREGMAIDWYATLKIASGAAVLRQFDASARTYLPDGVPPIGEWGGPLPQIRLGRLAETLERLAEAGPRDFYDGEIAAAIVADCAAIGNTIAADDLADYEARIVPVEPDAYRDATVFAAPGLSAGPTLRHALALLSAHAPVGASPDGAAYGAYADALMQAYADRLDSMGDADEHRDPSCTTHMSVVDRHGNVVALTQTLLSLFGSKVMLPGTGIMMNNGIMWFDPRPGRPNSIAAGRRPLSNMCPTILQRADGSRVGLGASGGRRIMPAVFQLISFLIDHGMDLEAAMHTPRIDVSGRDLVEIDRLIADDAKAVLAQRHPSEIVQHGAYPALFACPNLVACDAAGTNQQASAFVMSPWAEAVAA